MPPDPYRSSDHDPILVGLALDASARQAKLALLDDLRSMTPGGGKDVERPVADAIAALEKSLAPALWIDGDHLDAREGRRVFDEERRAVQALAGIKNPPTWVGDLIARLVAIDRRLVTTAIDESTDAAAVDKARQELAQGDDLRDDGQPAPAIEHYRDAWKFVVR